MLIITLSGTIITVNGISALGITTNAVAHEDKNWKTFISPEYKFSIDHHSDLGAHNHLSDSKIPSVFFFNFKSGLTSPSTLYIHQNVKSLQNLLTMIWPRGWKSENIGTPYFNNDSRWKPGIVLFNYKFSRDNV
jgi:hypothetical protein